MRTTFFILISLFMMSCGKSGGSKEETEETFSNPNPPFINKIICHSPSSESDSYYPFNGETEINDVKFYVICSGEELAHINDSYTTLHNNYILGQDIDMNSYYNGANYFMIGSDSKVFNGTIHGNSFSIKNFKYINESNQYSGFIANAEGGSLKNISFENIDISSTISGFTGLIGKANFYSVSDIAVQGKIEGDKVGAVYSDSSSSLISNTYLDLSLKGNVIGSFSYKSNDLIVSHSHSVCVFDGVNFTFDKDLNLYSDLSEGYPLYEIVIKGTDKKCNLTNCDFITLE